MGQKYCQLLGSGLGLLRWHYYVDLVRLHLAFALFPFPLSTAQFIGALWKNR
jgi:hypothetical protein